MSNVFDVEKAKVAQGFIEGLRKPLMDQPREVQDATLELILHGYVSCAREYQPPATVAAMLRKYADELDPVRPPRFQRWG